ncbi:MAG: hypothetical protein KC546_08005 [Anaerolineae bacterium]|nr:hypothetical protein [Anaerolineae bacterium]MCA9888301.1 hypothetical protein [Anaerolineae bacterium]MCA9895325.1 hypothetical protein [Anaerolineae bacterium]MCB9461027.1 hypothetical protein [Anaerolineaceae bacterium]
MSSKTAEQLWKTYPGCHLHCDVTSAGSHTYRIVMSVLDDANQIIQEIEHYGNDDLSKLKEEALAKLVDLIKQKQ